MDEDLNQLVPFLSWHYLSIQVPSRFRGSGWVSWRATSSDLGPTLRRFILAHKTRIQELLEPQKELQVLDTSATQG